MSTNNLSSISARIQKAAEILKLTTSDIETILKKIGIENNDDGLRFLNSKITTLGVLESTIRETYNEIGVVIVIAASHYLKGVDPFAAEESSVPSAPVVASEPTPAAVLVDFIQANKNVCNMSDSELLGLWVKFRDDAMETELNRRSKGQPFIVLQPGKHTPGKEEINTEITLDLLRTARRRTVPSIVPLADNTFATVFKISELNINDRIIETCPICGEILWKGFCSACESNFLGMGDDERSYVKLVVDSGKINTKSSSDRKALVTSAAKGIDDLKLTWPGIFKSFEELKVTGGLPKLRRIADRPSKAPADPFHVSGNRQF